MIISFAIVSDKKNPKLRKTKRSIRNRMYTKMKGIVLTK